MRLVHVDEHDEITRVGLPWVGMLPAPRSVAHAACEDERGGGLTGEKRGW